MTCEWCGAEFERLSHRGPAPKFCSDAHRQAAFRARHSERTNGADTYRAVAAEHREAIAWARRAVACGEDVSPATRALVAIDEAMREASSGDML